MRTPSPLLALGLAALPSAAVSKAILGIDLGSLYMKVALVQRNSPLEIVTNLHSKRKTEQMVLFDAGSRFYGADASSLRARKPHLTPSAMSVMLGRGHDHPSVAVLRERHSPFEPAYNATRSGVCLTVGGAEYTPEELVAMVLGHAKDITAAYGVTSPLKDCVLTVPSFYTQHERRALLDAAELAELNVLALINENTAAALHFGIDRIDEAPLNYLFYNMGAGSLQVSVVRYLSYPHKASKYGKEKTVGAFEVLGSAWDATLGGASFDARLVDFMADEFNEIWNKERGTEGKDVRAFPKAMAKLTIQANKVKHVLSANSDIPVYVDALHDDVNYHSHVSRAKFEEICHDLLLRAAAPIEAALAMANVTLEELDAVEMIGGAMRVPKVQEAVGGALGALELGMHLNSDESMALGAAFHGANVSTSFKVRHVGMADVNPFPVAVDLTELDVAGGEGEGDSKSGGGLFGIGKKKKEEAEGKKEGSAWAKHATIFKLGSKLGVKKTIAFSHDKDVHVEVSYEQEGSLPDGTGLSIQQHDVSGIADFAKDMKEKKLGTPKVSLQFEMDTSGLTSLIKAEAVVEEIVIVEEEVEVEDEEEEEEKKEEGDDKTEEDDGKKEEDTKVDEKKEEEGVKKEEEDAADGAKEGEAKEEEGGEEKEEEKPQKKKTKMVQREKKKRHVRTLKVNTYNVGSIRPHSPEIMAESKAKLAMLAQADKERQMLEESKNKYESYIYHIRNRLIDDEDLVAKVTSEEQREALRQSAEDAEEWMFDDGYTADLATYEEKYTELSAPAEKVFFRMAELTLRPAAIDALKAKLTKIEGLMTKWETTMEHITEEERKEVLDKVTEARAWVDEKVAAQEATDATEEPAFASADVPGQTKRIESIVKRLMNKPKPKPPKKNETEEEAKNETEESEGSTAESGAKKSAEGEESTSEAAEGEKKEDEKKDSEGGAEEAAGGDGEEVEDAEKKEGDEL